MCGGEAEVEARAEGVHRGVFGPDAASQGPTSKGWDINGLELSREYLEEIRKMDTYNMACGYSGPVLLIHGTEDELVQVDVAYQYKDIYGKQMQMELIQGANHQYSSLVWKQRVYDLSVAFIKKQVQN